MSRKAKMAVLLVFLMMLAGIAFFVVYNQPGITGNRVANPDSYTLDIQRMHGTDQHTMELNAGDVLQIHFEVKKGALHLEIATPDGTVLYAGNGREASEFMVNIRQSGAYSVNVAARHAKGTIHIQREENGS